VLILPTAQPNRFQHVESDAVTEAEAVHKALAKADELRK